MIRESVQTTRPKFAKKVVCLAMCSAFLIAPSMFVHAKTTIPSLDAPVTQRAFPLEARRRRCRTNFCRKTRRAFRAAFSCLSKALKKSNFLEAEGSISYTLHKGKKHLTVAVESLFPKKVDAWLKGCVGKKARRYRFRAKDHKLSVLFPYSLKRR